MFHLSIEHFDIISKVSESTDNWRLLPIFANKLLESE